MPKSSQKKVYPKGSLRGLAVKYPQFPFGSAVFWLKFNQKSPLSWAIRGCLKVSLGKPKKRSRKNVNQKCSRPGLAVKYPQFPFGSAVFLIEFQSKIDRLLGPPALFEDRHNFDWNSIKNTADPKGNWGYFTARPRRLHFWFTFFRLFFGCLKTKKNVNQNVNQKCSRPGLAVENPQFAFTLALFSKFLGSGGHGVLSH